MSITRIPFRAGWGIFVFGHLPWKSSLLSEVGLLFGVTSCGFHCTFVHSRTVSQVTLYVFWLLVPSSPKVNFSLAIIYSFFLEWCLRLIVLTQLHVPQSSMIDYACNIFATSANQINCFKLQVQHKSIEIIRLFKSLAGALNSSIWSLKWWKHWPRRNIEMFRCERPKVTLPNVVHDWAFQ